MKFWRWAFSDVFLDKTRGAFAEFLIAEMIGRAGHRPPDTTSHDVETASGARIEVKCSAFLQKWSEGCVGSPAFTGLKTKSWRFDSKACKTVYGRKDYQADIYVLCLFTEKVDRRVDLFDLAQWAFYVLSKRELKRITNNGESIKLTKLEEERVQSCSAEDLSMRVAGIES